jgi:hypothetical protein
VWHHDGNRSRIVVDPQVIALPDSKADDLTVTALRPGTFQAEVDQPGYEPLLVPFTITPLASVEIVPCSYHLRGGSIAWAPGATVCAVLSAQDGQWLADTSLRWSRGDDTSWGHEVDNGTGVHGIELTAGSFGTRAFDFEVTEQADRIEVDPGPAPCFHAFAGEREVVAPWTYVADSGSVQVVGGSNCIELYANAGTYTVTATALGISESVELTRN